VTFTASRYLDRRFHLQRYNCWHFTREVWLDLTGEDLGDRTPESLTRAALLGRFDADVPTFVLLDGPQEPCLVLMRRAGDVPHVGVYTGGRVLQITRDGPTNMPILQACSGYDSAEFYRGENPLSQRPAGP
jgi:hypothetical protein